MDPRDVALQSLSPTVMVPRFGEFTELTTPGHRFLVAANGLWLEVRRPWLYVRRPIAKQLTVAMPYGHLEERTEITCGPVPLDLLQAFSNLARTAAPLETAAWITWNEATCEFAIRSLEETSAGSSHVDVNRPRLDDDEHLVLDIHSHGFYSAGFSPKDNKDDRGEVKLAMVTGSYQKDHVSTAIRLCVLGLHIPMRTFSSGDGQIEFKEEIDELSWKGGLTWNMPSRQFF